MNRLTPIEQRSARQRVESELAADIEKWQALLDETKLQLHLGPREIRDRLEPEVTKVEQELRRANQQLRLLEGSPESESPSIRASLHDTLSGMRKCFHWIQTGIASPDEA